MPLDAIDTSDPDEVPQKVEDSEEAEEGKSIKNDPQFSLKALKKVDSEVDISPPTSYSDDGEEVIPQFVPASNDDDEKNSDLIRVKSKKRWIDGITYMWGKKKRGGSNHRRLWARGNRNRGNGNEDERTKRRYVLMTPHQYHALKGKSYN